MERQKMKKKGFTLVELLVVIAIIAMLLAILMPALSKVRQLAQRLMCGTNLAGVGKAMLSYTNEDKYERFPIAGSPGAVWDHGDSETEGENSFDWRNSRPFPEVGVTDPTITMSANLYLLVKFADVGPDQFVCPGTDQIKFELSLYDMTNYTSATIVDVWDFGKRGTSAGGEKSENIRGKGHVSYSYQSPVEFLDAEDEDNHRAYPITTRSNPRRAVMADRNPYWQLPIALGDTTARLPHWDPTNKEVYTPSLLNANSMNHQKDGQNVLFADLHTSFEKGPNCGIDMDNIYTVWGTTITLDDVDIDKWRQCGVGAPDIPMGKNTGRQTPQQSLMSTYYPVFEQDSFLVSDLDG